MEPRIIEKRSSLSTIFFNYVKEIADRIEL
jgi:hypothetical protein